MILLHRCGSSLFRWQRCSDKVPSLWPRWITSTIAPFGQFINSEYPPSVALGVSIDFFDCLFAMIIVYYLVCSCFVSSLVVGLRFAKYRRCLRMNFPHKYPSTPNKHLVNFISNFRPVIFLGVLWFVMHFGTTRERSMSHSRIITTDWHRLITKYSIMCFIHVASLCRPKYTVWQRFYVHSFMNFTGTNNRGIDFLWDCDQVFSKELIENRLGLEFGC